MAIADQIVGVESGGDPGAQNPNSSAGGAGQFIDSTWLSILAKHRPDLAAGRSPDELLALKFDPVLSKDMTAAYAADNGGILSRAGLPVTPGTQYLAHFAGPQGAIGLLNADPNAPAGAVLGQKVVAANPFLAQMTAGDVAAWADRKMGGKAAAKSAPLSMAGPKAASAPADDDEDLSPAPAATAYQFADTPAPNFASPQPVAPMLLPQRPRINLSQIYAQRRGRK